MRSLIDSVFTPFLSWLESIYTYLFQLSVPLARPLDLSNYFGYFKFLGVHWMNLINTICALGFIYLITYIIIANIGLIIKFKNLVKWW